MRVIKHTRNAVILRVKAHYYALYAFRSSSHYCGRVLDMTFSEIFSANLKIYEYRLGLGCMKIASVKKYTMSAFV